MLVRTLPAAESLSCVLEQDTISVATYTQKTIEGYIDSVLSLTFNTTKPKWIIDAVHSSRYLLSNLFIKATLQWLKYSTVPND